MTDHLFGICFLFDILYLLWSLYLAFIVFSISLAVVFNLYSCLAFHTCGNQVPAREELEESSIEAVRLMALPITQAS